MHTQKPQWLLSNLTHKYGIQLAHGTAKLGTYARVSILCLPDITACDLISQAFPLHTVFAYRVAALMSQNHM